MKLTAEEVRQAQARADAEERMKLAGREPIKR
jgi:hypothetical protein